MQTRSMSFSSDSLNFPACNSPEKSFFLGGTARVSAARTMPPSLFTQFATDSPVSPRPRTSTRLSRSFITEGFLRSEKAGSRII